MLFSIFLDLVLACLPAWYQNCETSDPRVPTPCLCSRKIQTQDTDSTLGSWHYRCHLSKSKYHHLHESYMSRRRLQKVWEGKEVPTNADNVPTTLSVGWDPLERERNPPNSQGRWASERMYSLQWEGKANPKPLKTKWKHSLWLGSHRIFRARKVAEEKINDVSSSRNK